MKNPSSSLKTFGEVYFWITIFGTLILLLSGGLKQPEVSEYTGRILSEKFTALSFGYLFALIMHAIAVKLIFSYLAFMAESQDKKTLTQNDTSI